MYFALLLPIVTVKIYLCSCQILNGESHLYLLRFSWDSLWDINTITKYIKPYCQGSRPKYRKQVKLIIKLTFLIRIELLFCLFNPLFHNLIRESHRLKLVITRKINLKKLWNFFLQINYNSSSILKILC